MYTLFSESKHMHNLHHRMPRYGVPRHAGRRHCEPRPGRSRGFSLLEALVAFSILALSLTVLLQIFSTGLRSVDRSDRVSIATLLAESRLAELDGTQELSEGETTGHFDERYDWRVTVTPFEGSPGAGPMAPAARPVQVTLEVFWQEAGHEQSIELSALRLLREP